MDCTTSIEAQDSRKVDIKPIGPRVLEMHMRVSRSLEIRERGEVDPSLCEHSEIGRSLLEVTMRKSVLLNLPAVVPIFQNQVPHP